MTATMVFNQIMDLPDKEKHKLLARLAKERELMEDLAELEDAALFDERRKESGGIPLEETLRKLKFTK